MLRLTGLINMSISSVNDLQCPPSFGFLAPVMYAEERPVVKIRTDNISRSFKQQSWCCAHRRGEKQPEIAAREEPERHFALYMLQEADFVQSTRARGYIHGHGQRAAVWRVDLSANSLHVKPYSPKCLQYVCLYKFR